ncbi:MULTISPECIES: sigma-54-dependent transcriptional regulator [unclassified Yoonia]|uniref:sigma-54-dependent transcriptional regulator n=1 Tax=unclassified Yoonia TaxID=2629118 RepID=UPI002AFE5DD9|nr:MULTISPECIES: response regulator [unclassified Yoonia]
MLKGRRIALIEDDEIMGGSIAQRLEIEGAEVLWIKQVARAVGALRTPRAPIDAVVCDIRLPDGNGEDIYATLCRTSSPPPFLFITGQGEIGQAVRLIQAGAADYITKPFDMARFLDRLVRLMPAKSVEVLPPLIGLSPAARRIEALVQKLATDDAHLIVLGGPGLAKGLIAARLHSLSDRLAAPFMTVNLAREAHVEAALFGVGGAIERLGDGVLFLNAIERMTRPVQSRLFERLDAGFTARIISAADPLIEERVAAQQFRPDLYARLAAAEIAVPPLRDRPDDALWLLDQMFDTLNARRASPLRGISALTEIAVRDHDWPGGGREVRSRLMRAMQSAQGELLQPTDLFPERLAGGHVLRSLAEARDAAERAQIVAALEETQGQIGAAARLLRVARTTLWEKMQKLGLS